MAEERPAAINRMAGPIGPRPVAPAAVLTPKEVFVMLRRHMLLIIALTGLGLATGGATWYLLRTYLPRYTASTYIRVLPPGEIDPMTIGRIYPVSKDIQYGYRVSMASLITQQDTFQDLLGRDPVKRTEWYARMRDETKRIRDLKKHLNAFAHRDASYVEISMTCQKADEAALIINEMADLFVTSQGGFTRRDISARLTELESRRDAVQRELDTAERALGEVRTTWGMTDLERPLTYYWRHTIEVQLDELAVSENELTITVEQVKADIKNLEKLATGPVAEQVEHAIESDPVMITLAQQLALTESELTSRLTRFGENHRVVLQLQEYVDQIKEKRRVRKAEIAEQFRRANLANAQDGLAVLQARLAELEKLRDEMSAKKRDLDLARVQYAQRAKIRDERTMMLDEIKQQIEKVRMLHDDPETLKVQLVGLAPVPLEMATSRRWWVHFPIGTVIGFLLGVGISLLIELLNDLVRTPRDVARFLHIPLLGVIPDADEDDQLRGIDPCYAVRQAPYSVTSESYRRCRTNLKLSGAVESLKALLVTSGMPGDGTTSMAANLAMTLVAENKKVLLIDANFRRPSTQTLFPKVAGGFEAGSYDFGLSSVLTNQCSPQNAIRPGGIEGLSIIDSGPLPANPAELLGSARMEQMLKEQRNSYDHIVIDGPPVLLVSDSKALSRFADATILVFNAAATRRGAAQRTIAEMRAVGAKVVGCVLLAARALKGGYFEEQFRFYQEYQKAQPVAAPA